MPIFPGKCLSVDDALSMLARNLLIGDDTQDVSPRSMAPFSLPPDNVLALDGVKDFNQKQNDWYRRRLADYWQSIGLSADLLQTHLKLVRRDHSELIEELSAEGLINEKLYEDLRLRTQSTHIRTRIDISNVAASYQAMITARGQFHTFTNKTNLQNRGEIGCNVALSLGRAIDWIYGAIDILNDSYSRIEQARAVITPVFRLERDSLAIIFELLANYEAPSKKSLGWMRLAHVCSAWRRVVLSLPSLWARDAYALGPSVATGHTLARAQDAVLSVSARRLSQTHDGNLSANHSFCVDFSSRDEIEPIWLAACREALRDLHISCGDDHEVGFEDESALHLMEHVLSDRPQPHLRSITLWAKWPTQSIRSTAGQLTMAPHPNLRYVRFVNMFMPFSLAGLARLHLTRSAGPHPRTMPQEWLIALLHSLESCPNLTELRLVHWILPVTPAARRIELPHLATLGCSDARLLGHLRLPALRYVQFLTATLANLEVVPEVLEAIFASYGLSPRGIHLSQRVSNIPITSQHDILMLQLSWEPLARPPSLPLTFKPTTFTADAPGPGLSFGFYVRRALAVRSLSFLFAQVAHIVGRTAGTQSLETIGFDNETREHTFFGVAPSPYQLMLLPSMPTIRRVDIPLRDIDTTYHLLHSLGVDVNVQNLPLLQCIRLRGSLSVAEKFMEMHRTLAVLLRARMSHGMEPIGSLEFDLSSKAMSSVSLHDSLGKLNQALGALIILVNSDSSRSAALKTDTKIMQGQVHLLVTITYST
ncbi:unnamed protein product [Peniophora sp. CBMAI 1063]|nr:unnamed protein product [Peniophora sp. CBMAI 1063]